MGYKTTSTACFVNISHIFNECGNYYANFSINLQDVLQVSSKWENKVEIENKFSQRFWSVPPEVYFQTWKCSEPKTILKMLAQVFIGSIVGANIYLQGVEEGGIYFPQAYNAVRVKSKFLEGAEKQKGPQGAEERELWLSGPEAPRGENFP